MNYLRNIAERIREALPAEKSADTQATLLFDLYAALALSRGANTTERDVHDAWVVWMLSRGEEHPAMIPYEGLDEHTRAEDWPFAEAIRRVSSRL